MTPARPTRRQRSAGGCATDRRLERGPQRVGRGGGRVAELVVRRARARARRRRPAATRRRRRRRPGRADPRAVRRRSRPALRPANAGCVATVCGERRGGGAVGGRRAEVVGDRDQQLPAGGGARGPAAPGRRRWARPVIDTSVPSCSHMVERRQHDDPRARSSAWRAWRWRRPGRANAVEGGRPVGPAGGARAGPRGRRRSASTAPSCDRLEHAVRRDAERLEPGAVDIGAERDLAGMGVVAEQRVERVARRPGPRRDPPRPRARSGCSRRRPAAPSARIAAAKSAGRRARGSRRATSRLCGAGPAADRRSPRSACALRTRSSVTGCWLPGSPPTTTTRSASSMSPSSAPAVRSAARRAAAAGTPRRGHDGAGQGARGGQIEGDARLLERSAVPPSRMPDASPAQQARHGRQRVVEAPRCGRPRPRARSARSVGQRCCVMSCPQRPLSHSQPSSTT